jgi:hypothetical protein
LKKQSQFAVGTIGVSSYMKGYYGKLATRGAQKKQTQSKVYPERSRMGQNRTE